MVRRWRRARGGRPGRGWSSRSWQGAAITTAAHKTSKGDAKSDDALLFAVFNEVGIINQLATTRLESVLPDGLLLPHFTALNHLVRLGDGKSMSSMAFAFQVTKATMTNTVRRLSDRGLVEVRPDPEDGRGKLVFLTAAGRAAREDAIAGLVPSMRALAREVGLERFEAVLPHLSALRTALDAQRNVRSNDPAARTLTRRQTDGEPADRKR